MSSQNEHGKIITRAAREVLRPLGLYQQGRSRTWLDDQGWWVGVIEFQPSSWGRGSYLNVGACFLWHLKDYLSFDYGSREQSFVEFTGNEQEFPARMLEFAHTAALRVRNYRTLFSDHDSAAVALADYAGDDVGWPAFNAAVACGLSGRITLAKRFFRQILAHEDELPFVVDWVAQMKQRTAELLELVARRRAFTDEIERTIKLTRIAMKLD